MQTLLLSANQSYVSRKGDCLLITQLGTLTSPLLHLRVMFLLSKLPYFVDVIASCSSHVIKRSWTKNDVTHNALGHVT